MQSTTQKNLLPFSVCTSDDGLVLTEEIEKAVIFCLSEINRGKGGGLLRKKPPEKTVFIGKVYYPLWIGLFENQNIIFDGLNIWSNSLNYQDYPSTEVFRNNLKETSSTRQIFSTFLCNNTGYFEQTNGQKTYTIQGLITNLDFAKAFLDYSKEATSQKKVLDSILISSAFKEKEIAEKIKELLDIREKFRQKLADLSGTIKQINSKTQEFVSSSNDEITAIENKYKRQIQQATARFEKQKMKLNKSYANNVTEISEKYEKKIVILNKEGIGLQKSLDAVNRDLDQINVDMKNAQVNKDEVTEQKLKAKKNALKTKISDINLKVRVVNEKTQELERIKKEKLFQLRQENEAKMEDASKELNEINASKDAEKKIRQDEMEKLEEYSSKITGDIDKWASSIEETINAFDGFGIKNGNGPLGLVYMPFYLIGYIIKSDKRYIYIAPSKANDMDISLKLRCLGRKKITLLLDPRSNELNAVLNRFMELLNQDVGFRHEITEACVKQNILNSEEERQKIRDGLNNLKEEGWISDEEYADFSQNLT